MKKENAVADATDAGRVVAAAKPDFSLIDENLLKSRIHTIRGVKVMLDADLAEIYGYSTKRFNEQVKNNIEKFDEDFRFQLTSEEAIACSRSKKSALNSGGRGSNIKYNPFAFTEQGIYMLMTVLKGERAIAQSKALIRLFKQMKDYIVAENQLLLGNNAITEIAAQTIQNTRDIALLSNEMRDNRESLQKVMENFVDPASFRHYLILNGQKLEADVAYAQIYGMAKKIGDGVGQLCGLRSGQRKVIPLRGIVEGCRRQGNNNHANRTPGGVSLANRSAGE